MRGGPRIGVVVAVVWILTLAVAAGVAQRLDFLLYLMAAGAVSARIRHGRRSALLVVVLACVCGALGSIRSASFERARGAVERAAASAGAALVTLDGVVASFPQTGLHGTSFDFETVVGNQRARLQVRAECFDTHYGDRYRLRARFVKPSPTGRAFLGSRGLSGSVRVRSRDLTRLGRAGNPIVRECVWPLHRFARTRLSRAMGTDAGLAIGMLLGERAQLADPVRDAVRGLGITHLLAISGMHLTTVAGCIVFLTRRRPRWRSCVLVLALTVYTAAVGDVESLTRAYLMALLVIGMQTTLRPVRPVDALAVAWFVMTCADPLSLRSVGLQLSFAATFAVLMCLPLLARVWHSNDSRVARLLGRMLRPLAAAFALSLAVELFIAPLQLHHFGSLSPVGPLATVVFFVPVTVVLAGALPVAVLVALVPAHEWPGGALGWLSTRTEDLIVACGRIAPGTVGLPEPSPWLYYGGILLGWHFRRRRAAPIIAAALIALAFC